MRLRLLLSLAVAAPMLLGGCMVRTAASLVTLPVRVASGAVDAVTTSQAEADRAAGRRMRQEDERRGREARRERREGSRERDRETEEESEPRR